MKLADVINRIVVAMLGVVVALLGIGIIYALVVDVPLETTAGHLGLTFDAAALADKRIWLWIVGLLCLPLGLMLLRMSADVPRSTRRFEISAQLDDSAGVQVSVSQDSLKSLLAHVARQEPEIRGCRSSIHLNREGWDITCALAISPESSIPEVSREFERDVFTSLEHHTGMPVARLNLQFDLPTGRAPRIK